MRGCILVHGLTGTPGCVGTLREALLKEGYRVVAPCLAGHGGTLSDLANSTWPDWYRTIRVAHEELRRSCNRVFYAGISLGALLGLKLAIDEGWGIRALSLMATPLVLTNLERFVIPVVKYSPLRWVINSVNKDLKKSVADPEGRRQYAEMSLSRVPVPSVYQICDLQRVLRPQLHKISNPLLLAHARHDRVAPAKNVKLVQETASSDIIEVLMLDKSEHVIAMDMEKEFLARRIVEFFNKFS